VTPASRTVPFWNTLTLSPSDAYFPKLDNLLKGSGVSSGRGGAMLRNRILILLGGCLLASSAAWADEVG